MSAPLAVRKPKALQAGDKVRLVSPASPLVPEKVQSAVELLKQEGYRVELGRSVFAARSYFAGTDEERARDLIEAFEDPDAVMVLCSRGGAGSARLIPYLDLDRLAASSRLSEQAPSSPQTRRLREDDIV